MSQLKQTLEFALGLKRPHTGKSVVKFKEHLRHILPGAWEDEFGNIHYEVGESRTLFSAHTDTVHKDDGANSYVIADETIYHAGKPFNTRTMYRAHNAVLGADDGAGCALLVHLATNKVPGYYVFHHAEEVGGKGSTALAQSEIFKNRFDRAIAFDRKATHSIITSQSGGNCCSLLFAGAFAGALNTADDTFMFTPDDTGVYTDTAEYIDQIAECTNVSCGYYSEHTQNESLDFTFLERLAAALLTINFEALPVGIREPEPIPEPMYNQSFFFQDPRFYTVLTPTKKPSAMAEAAFYDLVEMYPDAYLTLTDNAIDTAICTLGEDGIWDLVDAVSEGEMTQQELTDAIRYPITFLQKVKYENSTYKSFR